MTETFLPSIKNASAIAGQGIAGDAQEIEIYERMASHEEQRRPTLTWNALLTAVARAYAERMARENFVGHTDPQGFGPNHRIRQAGYKLPANYGTDDDDNNCESLLWGGDGGIQQVWNAWMGSNGHRTHILGLLKDYAEQTQLGVGHYEMKGSRWWHYYVILTAPPEA